MSPDADLVLDLQARRAFRRGRQVSLSPREFALLAFLHRHPRTAFSRDDLLREVWDVDPRFADAGTVTVHVRRIRQKLEDDADAPLLLQTVRGLGYRLDPDGAQVRAADTAHAVACGSPDNGLTDLLAHLGDADLLACQRLLQAARDELGSLSGMLTALIVPALAAVGRGWAAGTWSVADEHAATELLAGLLARQEAMVPVAPTRGRIVLTVAAGDLHTMPLRLVGATLAARGLRCYTLGGAVPEGDLLAYLARVRPRAVLVGCSMRQHSRGLRGVVGAARALDLPVIVGGAGITSDEQAHAVGASAWARDGEHAFALLEGGGLRAPAQDLHRDERMRPALSAVALARDALRRVGQRSALPLDEEPSGPWASTMQMLVGSALAADGFADASVLAEDVDWWRSAVPLHPVWRQAPLVLQETAAALARSGAEAAAGLLLDTVLRTG